MLLGTTCSYIPRSGNAFDFDEIQFSTLMDAPS